jgi:hypothetical protein
MPEHNPEKEGPLFRRDTRNLINQSPAATIVLKHLPKY